MRNILVIGADGFIGSACATQLSKQKNFNVVGVDNFVRHGSIRNIDVKKVDASNKTELMPYIEEADVILNLAAINGTQNFYEMPKEVFEVSVTVPITIFNCLEELGAAAEKKHVILFSSGEVYNEPASIPTDESVELVIKDITNPRFSYGGGKIVQELLGRYLFAESGFKVAIIRPHNVYGPNMGFQHVIPEFLLRAITLKKENQSDFIIQGTGQETRAFCHISDFIKGLEIVIENMERSTSNFDIFHIGFDDEISIKQLATLCCKAVSLENYSIITTALTKGSTSRRCPDISKLQQLGYNPTFSLIEGIEDCINHDYELQKLFKQ